MNKFFILGMPRSRTFWLSQFLGCVHEALWYYPNYKDFLATQYMGDSTTCYPYIKDHIKDHPKVIVHRDKQDVQRSIKKLFGNEMDLSVYNGMENEDGLHVQYSDINDRLEDIWTHCKSDSFPTEKAEIMKNQILNNEFLVQEVQSCLRH